MVIYNYGLHWMVDDVFWGVPKNPASLLGIRSKKSKSDPVDFREQAGIYVLYDDYDVIYIGQAGDKNQKLFERLKQHRGSHLAGRWDRFSWFGTRFPITTGKKKGQLSIQKAKVNADHATILNHVEAILIATAEPRLNLQGGKFGRKTEQFLQFRDPRLGPNTEEMIQQIWSKENNERNK